jgi:glycosyltransferase involved in cell wall biosynthesis
LLQPYWQPKDYPRDKIFATSKGSLNASKDPDATHHYANDLISEVDRFTQLAVKAALCHEFDIIHAHDWMTFKAGVILTEITGKPLVVHVHSLEYDRCGTNGFGFIHERERLGILAADAIIAVSGYTKSIILQEHPVDESKIYVVHNGVTAIPSVLNNMVFDSSNNQSLNSVSVSPTGTSNTSSPNQKRVLFFGRITLQKGPEYFVEAARNVVSIVPNVLFVMAGQGDMRSQLMARVEELGLGQNFSFPGFLRGAELDRELSLADLYIMPSKSEPFGISALEAIQRSIPVLLSRQSGVREVILNALSFDFWDTRRLSDLIINCLEYPELGNEMASQAAEELKILQWEEAARKTCEIYQQLLGEAFLPTDEPYFPPSLVDDLEIESSVLESSYYSTAEKTSQHKRIEQTLRLS